MTVLMAMRGFTTQNCRVACGKERGGVRRQRVQEAKVPSKPPVHISAHLPCKHPPGERRFGGIMGTFMPPNCTKTIPCCAVVWRVMHSTQSNTGKGSTPRSGVAIKLGTKAPVVKEVKRSSLRRNCDNGPHVKALCVHCLAREKLQPLCCHPHAFTESPQRLCSTWDQLCPVWQQALQVHIMAPIGISLPKPPHASFLLQEGKLNAKALKEQKTVTLKMSPRPPREDCKSLGRC